MLFMDVLYVYCTHIYICMYLCICIFVCVYIYVFVSLHIYASVYVSVGRHFFSYKCTYLIICLANILVATS